MDKLDPKTDGTSQDIVADNIDKLRELFPDAFTEGSDADGPRWKVDFGALKACLGEYVEDERERYNFTWNGKARARRIAQTPSAGTLRPCPEESVNWDTTQNLFIEGDNLEVLKLLQKSYHKQVKMIYIDPPYNTGGEFIYPDRFQDNLDTYLRYTGQVDGEGFKTSANAESAGRYHTNWLNMMYPRLRLARNLLKDDGVIFVSIDDHEVQNLRQIMDEIFGPENFITTIMRKRKKEISSDSKNVAIQGEYIIAYGKSETTKFLFEPLSESYISKSYREPTEQFPDGKWRPVPITVSKGLSGGGYRYLITTPSGKTHDRLWAYPEKGYKKLEAKKRLYFGSDNSGIPQRVIYAHESSGQPTTNYWDNSATNKKGKKEILSLFEENIYETPKPTSLITRLASLSSKNNDIILDFFAGSCSTAHAIMSLNLSDSLQRRFFMVQLPEVCSETSVAYKTGFNTIADIGKERIRRAATDLKEKATSRDLDLGFKVYKLSKSNIVPWTPSTGDLKTSLFDSVDNIRHDRSEADVLSELLLKYGLDLAVPIEERDIDGKNVHIIGAGALVVCLADSVDLELVNGIAALKAELAPEVMRVVFKDNGFADDVVKTNAVQILRQAGVEDVKSL
ncbi:adenine specific DNA methylase Mod [Salinisphaera sp. S4-8]|uniref:site-specific DNA-methyltransferase n=1 Tax=Salinisphaera sp. S4-8 TaxID=633357 RepID=UPI00333FF29A